MKTKKTPSTGGAGKFVRPNTGGAGKFVRPNAGQNKVSKKYKTEQKSEKKRPNERNKYPAAATKKGKSKLKDAKIPKTKKQLRKEALESKAIAELVKKPSKKQKLQQRAGKEFRDELVDSLKSSRFRFINELLYTRKGGDAIQIFKEDADAFTTYHDGYRQQVEHWPINPLDRIIKQIQGLPKYFIVGDFGCGEGRLAKSIPNKVYSLDLVAARSDIIACDMANTPLETNSLNVAVYCLSLMGTNLKDFLLEANRVLKVGGHLKIAEVESRFEDIRKFIDNVQKCGFQVFSQDITTKIFYFLNFKKTKDVPKNSKDAPNFALKPCLYKKR